MRFTSMETRWMRGAMEAFAPPGGEGLALAPGEVDYAPATQVFATHANLRGKLGLRLAVWIAALSPVFLLGRLCTIDSLDVGLRAELITRLLTHRVYAIRGLSTLLKVCAAFAIFSSPAVRARSGYDTPSASTLRNAARRALPVLAEPERKVA